MDHTVAISFASSVVGGLIVAVANHLMTSQRDREQRKREMVTRFLIEAWQNLEAASRDDTDIHMKSKALEKAIADIQLFCSLEQIRLANKFAKEMTDRNSADTTALLSALQKDLRIRLGLPKSPTQQFFFRLTPKAPKLPKAAVEIRFGPGSAEGSK